ncbi:MAG: redoxin domain-containing protein [Phycisphaerae bacterium]|nr:redoxin domain-containing protein [Phycisphaerae bacterium]
MKLRLLSVAVITLGCLAPRTFAEPPDARQILEQASVAIRAVQTVRYEAKGEVTGVLAAHLPGVSGRVTISAIPGAELPKLRVDAWINPLGPRKATKLQLAHDGKHVTLADLNQKIFTRQEMPGGARLMTSAIPVIMREFTLDPPFEQESKSVTLEHLGTEKIGDIECDVIHAVYAEDGGEVRWHFAKSDHLPRRVQRTIASMVGESSLITSISKLDIDPEVSDNVFRVEKPAGFREVAQRPGQPGQPARFFLAVGSEAPDWTLKNTEGREISFKSLRGKIVLLDFWATWCRPCVMAMPGIQRLYEKYQGKPVAVFGVNCMEHNRRADPVAFMKERKFTYPVLLNGDQVSQAFLVNGIPTFYLIGPDGKILQAYSGHSPENERVVMHLIDMTLKKMSEATTKPAE